MNEETPNNEGKLPARRLRTPALPEPFAAAWFALQRRVVWPLEDRFEALGPGARRGVLLGTGAVALMAVAVVAVLALSSGSGSSAPTTTVGEAPAPREPLIADSGAAASQPSSEKNEPPRETLHGAKPVFSPPSPARKEGEKTGGFAAAAKTATGSGGSSDAAGSGESTSSSSSTSSSPTPDAAKISSDPNRPAGSSSKADDSSDDATTARAAVPDGPPAGPEALKVARRFAEGFVVYETGGEKAAFRDAFRAAATPQLAKALLQRPPKQPAGVKVPRAKVLNVVAGPSQGSVYKVSVSLLRVGVTSELRLDMERIKPAGKSGKGAEWRVTNVLG
jgi:hypothetical protein